MLVHFICMYLPRGHGPELAGQKYNLVWVGTGSILVRFRAVHNLVRRAPSNMHIRHCPNALSETKDGSQTMNTHNYEREQTMRYSPK